MSLNLSGDEIHGLIDYARDKFAAEPYPFAPSLRPVREARAGRRARRHRERIGGASIGIRPVRALAWSLRTPAIFAVRLMPLPSGFSRAKRVAHTLNLNNIQRMSLNLTDDEIHGLIDYARDKFAAEQYPFAPSLRPVREVLAKLARSR